LLLVPLGAVAFGPLEDRKKPAKQATALYAGFALVFVVMWFSARFDPYRAVPVGPVETLDRAGKSLWNYAQLYFAPNPGPMHRFSLESYPATWMAIAGWALFVFACVWTWRTWRTEPRVAWFAILALLITVPVSNLIPLPSLLLGPYRISVAGSAIAFLLAWACLRAYAPRWKSLAAIPATMGLVGLWLTPWGAKRFEGEISFFSTVFQYDPGSIVPRMNYIQALMNAARYRDAEYQTAEMLTQVFGSEAWRDYEGIPTYLAHNDGPYRYIRKNIGSLAEEREGISDMLERRAECLSGVKRKEEALRSARAATAIAPQYGSAWSLLGQMVLADGDPKGLSYLRRALALNPEDAGSAEILGKYYMDHKDWAEAKRYLEKAVGPRATMADPYLDLAIALAHLGDRAGAIRRLEEAKTKIVAADTLEKARQEVELASRPRK